MIITMLPRPSVAVAPAVSPGNNGRVRASTFVRYAVVTPVRMFAPVVEPG